MLNLTSESEGFALLNFQQMIIGYYKTQIRDILFFADGEISLNSQASELLLTLSTSFDIVLFTTAEIHDQALKASIQRFLSQAAR